MYRPTSVCTASSCHPFAASVTVTPVVPTTVTVPAGVAADFGDSVTRQDADAIADVEGKSTVIVQFTWVVSVKAVIVARARPATISRPTSDARKQAAPPVKVIAVPVVAAGVTVVAGRFPYSTLGGGTNVMVCNTQSV